MLRIIIDRSEGLLPRSRVPQEPVPTRLQPVAGLGEDISTFCLDQTPPAPAPGPHRSQLRTRMARNLNEAAVNLAAMPPRRASGPG
jgi:hypothetical protein